MDTPVKPQKAETSPVRGIRRLLQLLDTYRWQTLGGLLAVVVTDLVTLVVPWISKVLVDRLEARSIQERELLWWGALLLVLGIVSFLAKKIWRHLILGASKRIEADLRQQLLDKTMAMTSAQARVTESGKFLALASNDIPAVGQALAFGIIALFDAVFITGVATVLMLQLSPALTGWALLPFPILAVVMTVAMRLIYRRWDTAQSSLEALTEKTRESLVGIRTLRSYGQSEGDISAFSVKNRSYLEDMMSYVKVDASFNPFILLLAGSSTAVLLKVGGELVIAGKLTIGDLAAFTGYLGLLTWPMIAAGWMLVLLQRGSASIDRLDEILTPEGERELQTELPMPGPSTLEVRNLTFSYPGAKKPSLTDWSFRCAPGQTIGIVGPVGSGKSTLIRLLLALETIPKDTIFLDDHDLHDVDHRRIRQYFSPVMQEPFLFSDTIANNLRLGFGTAQMSELEQAVESADLAEDLKLFPKGLETELGERGISLSGGQRQRSALARALLKPSPILLLDDTLSAVDTLTEQRILHHLRNRKDDSRGLILISHRLSAVKQADEILVTRDGHIVDRGTHKELSARPGLYQELLTHQANEQEERELV